MNDDFLIEWNRAPGLSNLEKTLEVHQFLQDFKNKLEIYRAVFGEPVGKSVDHIIDQVEWFINFHQDKQLAVS